MNKELKSIILKEVPSADKAFIEEALVHMSKDGTFDFTCDKPIKRTISSPIKAPGYRTIVNGSTTSYQKTVTEVVKVQITSLKDFLNFYERNYNLIQNLQVQRANKTDNEPTQTKSKDK